jgi:hypothetical protein
MNTSGNSELWMKECSEVRCTRIKVATRLEQFTSGNLRKDENVLFINFRFTEAGAIQLRKFRTSNEHLRKFRAMDQGV